MTFFIISSSALLYVGLFYISVSRCMPRFTAGCRDRVLFCLFSFLLGGQGADTFIRGIAFSVFSLLLVYSIG